LKTNTNNIPEIEKKNNGKYIEIHNWLYWGSSQKRPKNELINYYKTPLFPPSLLSGNKKGGGEDIVKYLISFYTYEREIKKQWEGKEIDKYLKAK